ncbi:MAG TPA: methionyl-tRNA formyltransferase, partial [Sphingomicrobium sp.]|nr:methionyl-tRNA formyltransferase [Sphingomicrobium sp.]
PMLAAHEVTVDRKTAGQLTGELGLIGAQLMVQVLASLDSYPRVAQPADGVTYAAKVRKEEARIDWTQAAALVERQVRAFAPSPGAWFEANGERIKLLQAEVVDGDGQPGAVLDERLLIGCGDGSIRPMLVQRAGKAAMSPSDLLRGFPIPAGTRLP